MMSRMIPPRCDETVSAGERRIFQALEQLPDDFTVFHSLGIANHSVQVYGEIDFVIVCSEGVLCLEVKGGNVHREEGIWIHTTRHGESHHSTKNPFFQVLAAANALREDVRNRFGHRSPMGNCCFASGVVFPDVAFTLKGPEIIPEIIYSAASGDIEGYIKGVFAYWRGQLKAKHGFEPGRLSRGNVDALCQYIRGNFGLVSSLGTALSQAEEELVYLTEEQRKCLLMIAANPRILLEGGAGTGKTLLSVDQAVCRAREGQQVLFVCYNYNLAYYLQHMVATRVPHLQDKLHIRVFHQLLEDYVRGLGCAPARPQDDQKQYWARDLPAAFIDAVTAQGYPRRYDYLVIDEGQDLLQAEYLMCLDLLLDGGFGDGKWLVVYDPNQNLYGINTDDGLRFLLDGRPARFALQVNCRNTRQIIEFTAKTTGIDSKQQLRAEGPRVRTTAYRDQADQQRRLLKEISKLLSQGVSPRDICILSPRRLENSCLQGQKVFKGLSVQDIGGLSPEQWDENSVRFSTLYRFKGLESPVVMLVDVNSLADDRDRIRNYTAMTRAKAILHVFHSEDVVELAT